jgi:hypothetical protein
MLLMLWLVHKVVDYSLALHGWHCELANFTGAMDGLPSFCLIIVHDF